jgi:hypothetical protein
MVKAGMPLWLVDIFAELTPLIKAGYLSALTPDVEMLLERKPVRFSQFIQDHLTEFKS